jgi:hypothetical protein
MAAVASARNLLTGGVEVSGMKQTTWLAAVALVVLIGGAGEAHHSLAATYRLDETQTIEGTLVQVAYRAPHSFVHVEALDDHGVMRRWSAEWGDVADLMSGGVPPDLRVGDRIRIIGHPGRHEATYRLLVADIMRPVD